MTEQNESDKPWRNCDLWAFSIILTNASVDCVVKPLGQKIQAINWDSYSHHDRA